MSISWLLDPDSTANVDPDQAVLRIRDVYPRSRIRIKEFKYFNPKKWFLSSRKYDPGFSSRIRIPDPEPDFLPIPDPGVKKAPDPGSWIRIRNTGPKYSKSSRILTDPDPEHCSRESNTNRFFQCANPSIDTGSAIFSSFNIVYTVRYEQEKILLW